MVVPPRIQDPDLDGDTLRRGAHSATLFLATIEVQAGMAACLWAPGAVEVSARQRPGASSLLCVFPPLAAQEPADLPAHHPADLPAHGPAGPAALATTRPPLL